MRKYSEENSQMIYIGPNLSGGRLAHATVFSGGYPPHVAELINAHHWMALLFVPVEQYTEKLTERNRKGTALYLYSIKTKEV